MHKSRNIRKKKNENGQQSQQNTHKHRDKYTKLTNNYQTNGTICMDKVYPCRETPYVKNA